MEWWLFLIIYLGSFIVLISFGMHVVFSFLLVTTVGIWIYWGGATGLEQFMLSLYSSIASFTMLAVILFIFMGEVTFRSGLGMKMIDALNLWLGKLPGRLSLLAVLSGVVLSTMSGSSLASTVILGQSLVPEMEKRGYKKPMSLGPILGSGGLAIMIPPSGLAILVATIGEIPIGRFLIAIVIPGLIMGAFYAIYIITRCSIQPSLAAAYEVGSSSWPERLKSFARDVMPLAVVIFLVIGVIILGIASPSEAAATGTLGIILMAAISKKLSWDVLKRSVMGSVRSVGMILIIIACSIGYSQILAFSGATEGMIQFAVNLPIPPLLIIVAMQVVALILGSFMSSAAVMMIALPMFMPIVIEFGFNVIWFGALFLLNMEMGQTTPPYGVSLFAMKAVAPKDTTMGDIYRAALPFLYCDALTMFIMLMCPAVALWLPGIMK